MHAFECRLEHLPCGHLSQIYEGFQRLERQGVVRLTLYPASGNPSKPVILGEVTRLADGKTFKVAYDTLDGFNWQDNKSPEENLKFFRESFSVDYYFKRSFSDVLQDYSPPTQNVFPLGLNLGIDASPIPNVSKQRLFSFWSKQSTQPAVRNPFTAEFFESLPVCNSDIRIIFIARVWDPDEVSNSQQQSERRRINEFRAACIQVCRERFGSTFTGGMASDNFSRQYCDSLCLPPSVTERGAFIRLVQDHEICIATTGLHGSIGWKLTEYVAASRAIVTEPLQYSLPGRFESGANFLEFSTTSSLVESLEYLLSNRQALRSMMINNFHYYNCFVKPEMLVLNSLLAIS